MRRLFAIFLLVLLPVQFTWAVAAGYCRHGNGETTQHFGHHEHEHKTDRHAAGSGGEESGGVDNDCPICHAGCVVALTYAPMTLTEVEPAIVRISLKSVTATAPPGQPERPNWFAFA